MCMNHTHFIQQYFKHTVKSQYPWNVVIKFLGNTFVIHKIKFLDGGGGGGWYGKYREIPAKLSSDVLKPTNKTNKTTAYYRHPTYFTHIITR